MYNITTEKSVSGRKHQLSVRIQIAYVSKELPASTRYSLRQQGTACVNKNCLRQQGTACIGKERPESARNCLRLRRNACVSKELHASARNSLRP
jgi:hypothetical protein